MAVALVSLLWGTTWLASKVGVQNMPALQLSGIRQLIGGSLYIIYFLVKGAVWPKGKEWLPILVLSFLNIFLTNGLSTWGVKYISSGLGAIMAAMVPLWILLFTLMGKSARPSWKAVIGFLAGFVGICIIFFDHLSDFMKPDFRFGIFLSLTGTISWALGSIYTKDQVKAFNPFFSIGLQMMISGIALTMVTRITGDHIPLREIPAVSWLSIAYLAIFGSVLAFMAYIYAMQHLPTEQVSIYAYINPIVAVLLGAWLSNERLNGYIIIGGLVALLGVYLVNDDFMKKAAQPASQ